MTSYRPSFAAFSRSGSDVPAAAAACVEFLARLWDHLDGNCPPAVAERMEAHASSCSACERVRQSQERFLESLAALREKGPPVSGRARDRVRVVLDAERRSIAGR